MNLWIFQFLFLFNYYSEICYVLDYMEGTDNNINLQASTENCFVFPNLA